MAESLPFAEFASLIPGSARAALPQGRLRAARLSGGRGVNVCLRIDTADGRSVVLRLRRGPELAGADPVRELASQRTAAQAGLAPAIIAADLKHGWTLMEHVAAAPWTPQRLREGGDLERLATRLQQLHTLPPPAFPPLDALALLRRHCDLLAARGEPVAATLLRRGGELTAQLERLPFRTPVLCHGDPDVGNFLGSEPMLIDFEYAQITDATYDIALLLAYYPFLEARTENLLAAAGLSDAVSRQRLPLQVELCRLVNAAWERAQTALSQLD